MTTQPLNVPPPPGGATGKTNRTALIVLSVVGGLLLLTVIALLFLFIGRGLNGTPTGSETTGPLTTGSPTPTPTQIVQEEAPPAEDSTPRFTFFSAVTEVQCPNSGDKPEIQFSWETAHAVEVWYTSGDEDAIDDAYMQVPLNGNQSDLTDEHLFPCAHREYEDYTVTLLGENGEHVSETFRVTDLNWNSGGDDEEDE